MQKRTGLCQARFFLYGLAVCRAMLLNRAGKDVFVIVAFGGRLRSLSGGCGRLILLACSLKSQLHGRQHRFVLFFHFLFHIGSCRASW